MAQTRVLVVEDEIKIAALLRDYLEKAGFAVTCLYRGAGVVERVRALKPDLLLLDLMLPDADGLSLCREIRGFSRLPIIMLTARVDEVDRLLGLELGADDYICKPFSPREVVARVRVVLRRLQPVAPAAKIFRVGELSLDESARTATVCDRPLNLTPSEFSLLGALLAAPGRVFSRAELIDYMQGYEYAGYERTVDSHVKNLRKKIALGLPGRELIQTVYGIGYKLLPPASFSRS
ncbi:MAG: response regulator [Deltaproteobacteria bacterium]|nr:response regulator [Deltaproteobacteria bacterium]